MTRIVGGGGNIGVLYIKDEDRTVLWRTSNYYSYQNRGPNTIRPQYGFFELWTVTTISSGDRTTPLALTGADSADSGVWGQWSVADGGHVSPVFITGQTLDVNSNPLVGVTVRGFRTSDNLFVGQTTSDGNGNYALGTPYPVAHYLEAYLPGSPDVAGTTVNTLTPS